MSSLFILFGWGKVTKSVVGQMFERTCGYCNQTHSWQLCKNRTWVTLFFIPVIPYKTQYAIACPSCGSYIQLTSEQFDSMKNDLKTSGGMSEEVMDKLKYAGKNDVQINYLKQMEEIKNKESAK